MQDAIQLPLFNSSLDGEVSQYCSACWGWSLLLEEEQLGEAGYKISPLEVGFSSPIPVSLL